LTTLLFTAIQVDILSLGTHLEAYANLQPTFNSVRLCNRFGRGPHANITMLPPELISIIEDFLIIEERAKLLRQWSIDFRCYRLLCDPVDHVTKDQFKKYLKTARLDETMGEDPSTPRLSAKERVLNYLVDEFGEWCDTHFDRQHSWQDRCGMQSAWRRGIFTQHEDILKKHFGLDVWISHVRLDDYPEENFWETCWGLEPAHTTVAYLTLPGAARRFKSSTLSEFERDEKDFYIESGYGMPVHVPIPLSNSARARFKRMMQILDLKPYTEASQLDLDLYAEQPCSDAGEGVNKEPNPSLIAAPQLTMLIRHNVRSDEDD
jgi:hypothetical protein